MTTAEMIGIVVIGLSSLIGVFTEIYMEIRARPKGLIFVPKFKKRKENQYDGENYYIISK